MVEQESLSPTEISKRLRKIIDDVLATGDWESSIFLKTSATKLREVQTKAEKLIPVDTQGGNNDNKHINSKIVPPGFCRSYILMYQVNGSNLDGWYQAIKALVEFSVTRPAYKDESHVQEFIRAKSVSVDRHGYIIVNIDNNDFYDAAQGSVDNFGHQVFALKEKAIKFKNIVEFVHANKKRYAISDERLILLEE